MITTDGANDRPRPSGQSRVPKGNNRAGSRKRAVDDERLPLREPRVSLLLLLPVAVPTRIAVAIPFRGWLRACYASSNFADSTTTTATTMT